MSVDFTGKKICIIEDNDVIRKLFEILLDGFGAELVSFNEGEKALEWLVENQADLVLCDIMLPDMSGTDILKVVRTLERGESIAVVALTAIARQGNREKFLAEGFDGYISKPVNPETFAREIHQILQS